jgi:hypothetical protein
MTTFEDRKKADLIKKALKIVDELAELDIDDTDELGELIEKAEKLKRDTYWKL